MNGDETRAPCPARAAGRFRRGPASPASAVAAAVATALVSACSDPVRAPAAQPSSPAPTTATAPPHSASAGTVPGPGVPGVANPLDITRFKRNPCETLTPPQISDLLGDRTRIRPDPHGPVGPACGWFNHATAATVAVLYPNINDLGLTSVYRAKGGAYPFFLALEPVDGYPIVAYGEDDPRPRGECDVATGVSDRETLVVSITQSRARTGERDPCQSARDIAKQALGNLRRG
ncbi:DUF3558 domain-containing protein [Amycolatopsis sp. NPDC004079]|uniref:DUF3558 domain-containing protein n=1 Tax=Amycolatopsis sp. NPDC004079 TaxID=3154549 RepID=UPI0033BBA225